MSETPRTDAFERDTLSGIAEPLHQLQAYARHARTLETRLREVEGDAKEGERLNREAPHIISMAKNGGGFTNARELRHLAAYAESREPKKPHGETRLNGEGGKQ